MAREQTRAGVNARPPSIFARSGEHRWPRAADASIRSAREPFGAQRASDASGGADTKSVLSIVGSRIKECAKEWIGPTCSISSA